MMSHARSAWWLETKSYAPRKPRHRLASLGNPKKKKCSLLFGFARDQFFLKWKGHFSFWGSALQVFGQCGGANADSDGRAGEIRCIERSAKKANLVCKAEDWRWSSTWCRFSSIRMTDVYTGLPQSEV